MNATFKGNDVFLRDEFRDEYFCFSTKGHTMLEIFATVNAKYYHENAIYYLDEYYSKGYVFDTSCYAGDALIAYGLNPGDAIVMAASNSPESVCMVFGANAIGVKVYFVNAMIGLKNILMEAKKLGAKMAVVSGATSLEYSMVSSGLDVCDIIVVDIEDPVSSYSCHAQNFITFDNFVCQKSEMSAEDFTKLTSKQNDNSEPMIFLQTSGSSSGKPKTLAFTNEAITMDFVHFMDKSDIKLHDPEMKRALCILPFRLAFGWISVFLNLLGGNEIALIKSYHPLLAREYWKIRPSRVFGTPAIFNDFMYGASEKLDLSFLKLFYCCGFSLAEYEYQKFMEFLRKHNAGDAKISNGYGLGETLCLGTTFGGEHREGSCGVFCNGLDVLLLDDNGKSVKTGEAGRLFLSSKTMSLGYVDDEEATKESFVKINGKTYFKTGDLFRVDEEGHAYCLGREKRFYQPKGAPDKVNCETVANVMLGYKEIKNSVVIHIAGKDGFDRGVAFVETKNEGINLKNLDDYLSRHLLPYQIPNFVITIDKIPIANTGKPNYTELEKIATAKLT